MPIKPECIKVGDVTSWRPPAIAPENPNPIFLTLSKKKTQAGLEGRDSHIHEVSISNKYSFIININFIFISKYITSWINNMGRLPTVLEEGSVFITQNRPQFLI